MRKTSKIILLLAFIIWTASFSSGQKVKQRSWSCPIEKVPILERKVCDPNFEWDSATITEVMMKALSTTDTPGGVSLLFNQNESASLKIEPSSMALRDVLNAVISVKPKYRWIEDNGVINLFPTENYPLLNERVAKFNVENETMNGLLYELKQTKEFQSALEKYNLSVPSGPFFCCGLQSSSPPRQFTIKMKDASIKEILNEIVRQNGKSTWLYYEYGDKDENQGHQYYELYFLVDHF